MGGRLAALGIKYVVLEKRPFVGNNWTQRYESVRQHTVREYNNLPFERTWKSGDPLLLPGKIVAEGFENYVQKYNINLWTNATTTGSTWSPQSRTWTLNVLINGTEKRELVSQHLIIAIGAGVSVDNDPKIPGVEEYKGIIRALTNTAATGPARTASSSGQERQRMILLKTCIGQVYGL
jgi:cation diffusion facilitator CzcD-associated flavoprotein CzcO